MVLRIYSIPRFFYYLGILSIAQTIWRPWFFFTLSDLFFLISLLLTIVIMLCRKKSIFKLHPLFLFGVIVFLIGGIISSFRSNMPMDSLISVIKYLYLIVVWFWLGTTILQNEKHIYTTILLWSLSAALTSAGAIAQLVGGDIISWVSPAEGRMTGFTEHVNDLGGVTCVALIPALSLAFYNNIGYLRKWIHYVIAFLITAGLILSVSISGFIAAIISFLIWGIMDRAPIKKIVVFFIISAVSLSTISISVKHGGISVLDRLTDVSENKLYYETSISRLEVYHLAWKSILKNPLVGVGTGPYAGVTETGDTVHNVILLNWYESGVFGLIGIIFILFSLLKLGIYMIKISESENERILSVSLLASYIAFLVIGASQPIYYKRFGWISAALIMTLYALPRKSLLAASGNKL